jgi:hypothetical protein
MWQTRTSTDGSVCCQEIHSIELEALCFIIVMSPIDRSCWLMWIAGRVWCRDKNLRTNASGVEESSDMKEGGLVEF